jgi:phosphoserine phosphatase RsbU/P
MKNSDTSFPQENLSPNEAGSIDFNALFELSKLLNSSLDIQFILDHILLSSMGKMLVTRGCVLLKNDKNIFSFEAVKGIPGEILKKQVELNNIPDEIFYLEDLNYENHYWTGVFTDLNFKIGIPVKLKDKTLSVIFFGDKLTKQKFNDREFQFLRVISNIASTSIENSLFVRELKKLNKDLDKKIQQLNTLFDIGKEFGVLFENDKIIRLLSYFLMGQIGVQKYAILLKDINKLKIGISRIPKIDSHVDNLDILQNIDTPGHITSFMPEKLGNTLNILNDLNITVIIPLRFKSESKGIILLCDRLSKEEYSETDIEFISSLGNLAVLSMENARLFKETLEKQKLEEEIQIASEIQKGLLPRRLPEIIGYDVATFNIPSKQVGGDYFDIIKKSEDEFIITIADVSGKGIPAALLMANLQATIHAYSAMLLSLSEATGKINNIIFENTDMTKFITFFLGVLNQNENIFRYVNAGHNPPILLRRNGCVEYLEHGGVILGVMETSIPYEETSISLQKGDLIFFYTDGVSESMNSEHQEFTEERILQLIIQNKEESSQKIINKIYDNIKQHSAGIPQYDDITMICVKVTG